VGADEHASRLREVEVDTGDDSHAAGWSLLGGNDDDGGLRGPVVQESLEPG
jgi:hypothetical protein